MQLKRRMRQGKSLHGRVPRFGTLLPRGSGNLLVFTIAVYWRGSFLLHTLDAHNVVPIKVLADVQRYVRQFEQGSAGISDRDSDEEAVHGVFAQSFVVLPRGIYNVIFFPDRMFDVLSCIRIISTSTDSSACRAVRGYKRRAMTRNGLATNFKQKLASDSSFSAASLLTASETCRIAASVAPDMRIRGCDAIRNYHSDTAAILLPAVREGTNNILMRYRQE